MAMDLPFVCDLGELVYAKRLEKLHQEVQSGHPLVFLVEHCFYAEPYDRMLLLRYSKI